MKQPRFGAQQGAGFMLNDLPDFLAYGAWGLLAYVIVKFVLPFFKTVASRTDVEGFIYDKAKDSISYAYKQLDRQRQRYDELQADYEKLQKELLELKARYAELEKRFNEWSSKND